MPVLQSSSPADDLPWICRHWFGAADVGLQPLAGSSFSGSPPWLVESQAGRFVLKAFTPGTSPGRIRFVHALMRHLLTRGVAGVPEVTSAAGGETFVVDPAGRAWELQTFRPGVATFDPAEGQIESAVELLGRVHAATASLAESPPDVGSSPALARRVEQARVWITRPWAALLADAGPAEDVRRTILPRLTAADDRLRRRGAAAVIARIAAVAWRPLPRQSIMRDVWAAHVLFATDEPRRITGLIDFHAASTDTPATDLGRLLGSWIVPAAAEPRWWRERLAAYGRPDTVGLELVPFLAASSLVFGLDNWFRWLLVEGRRFADIDAVTGRIDQLLGGLSTALDILADRRFEPRFDR